MVVTVHEPNPLTSSGAVRNGSIDELFVDATHRGSGTGSLLGSFVGSIVVGFIYNFGQALLPELAYFVLFFPMLLVLLLRPQGLFGRQLP